MTVVPLIFNTQRSASQIWTFRDGVIFVGNGRMRRREWQIVLFNRMNTIYEMDRRILHLFLSARHLANPEWVIWLRKTHFSNDIGASRLLRFLCRISPKTWHSLTECEVFTEECHALVGQIEIDLSPSAVASSMLVGRDNWRAPSTKQLCCWAWTRNPLLRNGRRGRDFSNCLEPKSYWESRYKWSGNYVSGFPSTRTGIRYYGPWSGGSGAAKSIKVSFGRHAICSPRKCHYVAMWKALQMTKIFSASRKAIVGVLADKNSALPRKSQSLMRISQ